MRILKRVVAATLIGLALAAFALTAVGYGWIPLSGKKHVAAFLGETPEGFVAFYGSGWSDHQVYFLFDADRAWVDRAVAHADLETFGETTRGECLAGDGPWWFNRRRESRGLCFKQTSRGGSRTFLHFDPSTGRVSVFDFSS